MEGYVNSDEFDTRAREKADGRRRAERQAKPAQTRPDARISAALCIQADDRSSKLFLENPNPVLNFVKPDVPVENMFEFAKFAMVPGDLLLFPSWIKHGSGAEANQSDTRVMISINAH